MLITAKEQYISVQLTDNLGVGKMSVALGFAKSHCYEQEIILIMQ